MSRVMVTKVYLNEAKRVEIKRLTTQGHEILVRECSYSHDEGCFRTTVYSAIYHLLGYRYHAVALPIPALYLAKHLSRLSL